MPLPERLIEPVHVSRGTLSRPGVTEELEGVTNGTLANIIRQLSSVSKHAEEIFGNLFVEAELLAQRSATLQARVDLLAVKVTQLDSTVEEVSLQDLQQVRPFHSRDDFDQGVVSRESMPKAMREAYLKCDQPPPLHLLNPFRDDGKDGMKFYTDPNYFFELWRQEMVKDTEKKIHDRGKKNGVKVHGSSGVPKGDRSRKKVRQPGNTAEKHRHKALNQGETLMMQPNINNNNNQSPLTNDSVMSAPHQQRPGMETPGRIESNILFSDHASLLNSLSLGPSATHYNGQEPIYTPRILRAGNHEQTDGMSEHRNGQPIFISEDAGGQQQQQQQTRNTVRFQSPLESTPPILDNAIINPSNNADLMQFNENSREERSPTEVDKGYRLTKNVVNRDSLPPPPPPPQQQQNSSTIHFGGLKSNANDGDQSSQDNDLPPPPPIPLNANALGVQQLLTQQQQQFAAPSPPPPPEQPPVSQTTWGSTSDSKNAVNTPTTVSMPPPPPPMPQNGFNALNNEIKKNETDTSVTGANQPTQQSLLLAPKKPSFMPPHVAAQDGLRSDLLKAIRDGFALRKVEQRRMERAEKSGVAAQSDVASILARRVAVEMSDSDETNNGNESGENNNNSDSEYDSDEWADESVA